MPVSSPIDCFLLSQVNWYNVSGQSGHHEGQIVILISCLFTLSGNKMPVLPCTASLVGVLKPRNQVLPISALSIRKQLAERIPNGGLIRPIYVSMHNCLQPYIHPSVGVYLFYCYISLKCVASWRRKCLVEFYLLGMCDNNPSQ